MTMAGLWELMTAELMAIARDRDRPSSDYRDAYRAWFDRLTAAVSATGPVAIEGARVHGLALRPFAMPTPRDDEVCVAIGLRLDAGGLVVDLPRREDDCYRDARVVEAPDDVAAGVASPSWHDLPPLL